MLSIDADERVTPELAGEIRARLADTASDFAGFRVPIRSEILGRPFRYSGTQQDLPLRLFRRDRGRWTGLVHETVEIDGPVGRMRHVLEHRTLPNVRVSSWARSISTRPSRPAISIGPGEVSHRRPDAPPVLALSQAVPLQARVSRRRRGLDVLRTLGGVAGGPELEAARAGRGGRDIMIATHEAEVARRFDAAPPAVQDHRWPATTIGSGRSSTPSGPVDGLRILDLGCGKGRFSRELAARGARVVGLDLSPGMLAEAGGIHRVHATARRLPFGPRMLRRDHRRGGVRAPGREAQAACSRRRGACSDRAGSWRSSTRTSPRCRRSGPGFPASLIKRIDEYRGRWMYPARRPGPRALVLAPGLKQRAAPPVRGRPGRPPAFPGRAASRGSSGSFPRRG